MSDQSDDDSASDPENNANAQPTVDNHVDESTLRIMVSTDNHLGYAERDPIRGDDSFAAFEEVLLLAKRHNCDMVLLAGDLFHHNKPSRLTLHKTMTILRRHTMGPKPVQFQILSDQAQNFRSTVTSTVNYEDPHASVELPIFAIHGNHDDPTRDGGTEMLAALDLLAVNSLVNYFGRHDEVDKVAVSPVLIQKGADDGEDGDGEVTRVALFGMGSMRDERLNRMWQGKRVRFQRPASPGEDDEDRSNENNDSDSEEDNENGGWFNLFALHQNRDLGRGSKNCVHESMIPEWMDLVVWGHEHECLIQPSESAVGTFRITQPGSSVATSLTEGESMRKHVGILDIRGSQFRMVGIPLTNVRGFQMGSISLGESKENGGLGLDPEDPRIDEAMREGLTEEVNKLAELARNESQMLRRDASANGDRNDLLKQMQFHVKQPDQVLVRLKVEHSGFTTLHNQRFGSAFVNDLANPSDILLFHRKRATTSKKKGAKSKAEENLSSSGPIAPVDLDDINVEDIVKDSLATSDVKLQIIDEHRFSIAVDDFVSKEQRGTIGETLGKLVNGQQKKLVKRGVNVDDESDGDGEGKHKISTTNAVREACMADTQNDKADDSFEDDGDDEEFSAPRTKSRTTSKAKASRSRSHVDSGMGSDSDVDMVVSKPSKSKTKAKAKPKTKAKPKPRATKRSRNMADVSDDELVDEEEVTPVRKPKAAPKRRAAARKPTSRKRNTVDYSDEEIVDDDSDVEIVEKPIRRKAPAKSRGSAKRSRTTKSSYTEDSEDDDGDWGLVEC